MAPLNINTGNRQAQISQGIEAKLLSRFHQKAKELTTGPNMSGNVEKRAKDMLDLISTYKNLKAPIGKAINSFLSEYKGLATEMTKLVQKDLKYQNLKDFFPKEAPKLNFSEYKTSQEALGIQDDSNIPYLNEIIKLNFDDKNLEIQRKAEDPVAYRIEKIKSGDYLNETEIAVIAAEYKINIVSVKDGKVLAVHVGNKDSQEFLFVNNQGETHFKTFIPDDNVNIQSVGSPIVGTSEEGKYQGSGANNCLIAAIRGSALQQAKPDPFGKDSTDQEVRLTIFTFLENNRVDANFFVADKDATGDLETKEYSSLEQAKQEKFTGYVMIRDSKGDVYEGKLQNGIPTGSWIETNTYGRYETVYGHDGTQIKKELVTKRKPDGTFA